MYLESDAGLGKSTLVSALCENPGIRRKSVTIMKTATGEEFNVEGRDVHVVKIQVCVVVGTQIVGTLRAESLICRLIFFVQS